MRTTVTITKDDIEKSSSSGKSALELALDRQRVLAEKFLREWKSTLTADELRWFDTRPGEKELMSRMQAALLLTRPINPR